MAKQAYQELARDRSAVARQRDAALVRVARVRRATILGAGALTAALAGVVSAVAPGHTLGAKLKVSSTAAATPRRSSGTSVRMPPLANPAQLGLQAPSSPPQAAPQPPQSAPSQAAPAAQPAPAPAVSGGS